MLASYPGIQEEERECLAHTVCAYVYFKHVLLHNSSWWCIKLTVTWSFRHARSEHNIIIQLASKSSATMLHFKPKLHRLFTWSIISATKELTTNTALHFSVLANPRLLESMRSLVAKALLVTGYTITLCLSYIYSLHGWPLLGFKREVRHLQRKKGNSEKLAWTTHWLSLCLSIV